MKSAVSKAHTKSVPTESSADVRETFAKLLTSHTSCVFVYEMANLIMISAWADGNMTEVVEIIIPR